MNCELQFHDWATKRVNGASIRVCTFCGTAATAPVVEADSDEKSELAAYIDAAKRSLAGYTP